MSEILDKHFGISAKALNIWAQRSELLANNIANADTPDFKARDIDFQTVLQNQTNTMQQVFVKSTHRNHFGFSENSSQVTAQTKYRVPLQPSLDGNTVDSQVEHSLFAENAVRYQISLQFLNSKISGLVRTLREE